MASYAEILRALEDFKVGVGETGATLGTSMLAQPLAGLAGLGAGARSLWTNRNTPAGTGRSRALRDALRAIEDVSGSLTYAPRSDIGARGVANVAEGVEDALRPIARVTTDPLGEAHPALGAGVVAAANVIGPKGRPKAREFRTDPGAPHQGLLPGVEPLSMQEALRAATDRVARAVDDASFTDPQTGLEYGYRQPGTSTHAYRAEGPAGVSVGRGMPGDVEVHHAASGLAQADLDAVAQLGGHQPVAQMMARDAAVRDAEGALEALFVEAATAEIPKRWRTIDELRARRSPDLEYRDAVALERQIRDEKNRLPVIDTETGTVWRRNPPDEVNPPYVREGSASGEYLYAQDVAPKTPIAQHDSLMREQRERVTQALRERNAVEDFIDDMYPERTYDQPAWIEQLESSPLTYQNRLRGGRDNPANKVWWEIALGVRRDPAAMNPDTVKAFYEAVRDDPDFFQYGTMPRESEFSRHDGLQEMADIFGQRAGKRIRWEEYGSSDEPEFNEVLKRHGRGSEMYDENGDFKMVPMEHSRGDVPMYDEHGNVKEREKLHPVHGKMMVKREAEGGEPKRDSSGDLQYDYKLSEGGEPKRDRDGNLMYEKEPNPDYSESSEGRLSTNDGHLLIYGDLMDNPRVNAQAAGKSGALLYQTLLADASRRGYELAAGDLTDDNALRLLSNANSNWARTGINPRDLSHTDSGEAPSVRGMAEGPEIWRAEAEEARARIKSRGGDPDRLTFDGENFRIDGDVVEAGDIKAQLSELSPEFADVRDALTGRKTVAGTKVGLKTLQRMAFFNWLRQASPEAATAAAATLAKRYGPLFGVTGAGIGIADALREGDTD